MHSSFHAILPTRLTHWGRVTHICVGNLTIIGSDCGLSPGRHQVIIWTNTGILLIVFLGTHFSEVVIEILTFSFKKIRLKVSFAKWRPFCLGLNVLTVQCRCAFNPSQNHTLGCIYHSGSVPDRRSILDSRWSTKPAATTWQALRTTS